MTTIRIGKRPRYTQVDRRTIRDAEMSFRALGVLTWLLDKPDDWECNTDQLQAAKPKGEGRDAVRRALRELEELGYMRLEKWRGENGQYQSQWTVFERPNATEPDRETRAGDQSGLTASVFQAVSTETEREKTVVSDSDVASPLSGKPDCPRCQGRGSFYSATAGRDAVCPCTRPAELSVVAG